MSAYSIDFVSQAPLVAEEKLRDIILSLYGITEAKFAPLTGYDDLNFKLDECTVDPVRNQALSQRREGTFVLKITGFVEARNLELIGKWGNWETTTDTVFSLQTPKTIYWSI